MTIENVLAERYATPEIKDIFEEKGKILSERELWIAVMKAQRELGMNIPSEAIERYEATKKTLMSISLIKENEKHDMMSRRRLRTS